MPKDNPFAGLPFKEVPRGFGAFLAHFSLDKPPAL